MAKLQDIVAFCDQRTRQSEIKDFDGAYNGLQIENNGIVKKVGAAVDAGQLPFESAIAADIDFLICHHGLYWTAPIPLTGSNARKVKTAFDGNLAIYGAHLPLDCHPEIGNNALLAKELGLKKIDTFLNYEGNDMATVALGPMGGRPEISKKLQALFPQTYHAIEYGSEKPKRIGILTGSGQSAVPHMLANGIDTLITGELRQHHFNMAQELGLNLYPCGHYATEVFGVKALAAEVAFKFRLEWQFIEQPCRL
ncbi:Nif3-like dinuclear metal center hexameric protein [Coraliomargarita sp. SDUM461004]|uniref:Nif3-like dinuclear metal center hexameric protein n=1 Tax=Thalassobacterium sedimentorum TaxID=3041258 RepID=A0ABU1AKR0_9BACT|nr:Nif3-like dinuclear metal center hexameric protein [Coraliomargarita sp. SDUM461004]MDQ8195391.1 Nif3-like dinuclear metal center hexameric protein [Coraliomargarita sp. SDUM461004]